MFNVIFLNKHKSKKVAEAQAAATEPAVAEAEAAPVAATAVEADEAPVEDTATQAEATEQTASIVE